MGVVKPPRPVQDYDRIAHALSRCTSWSAYLVVTRESQTYDDVQMLRHFGRRDLAISLRQIPDLWRKIYDTCDGWNMHRTLDSLGDYKDWKKTRRWIDCLAKRRTWGVNVSQANLLQYRYLDAL